MQSGKKVVAFIVLSTFGVYQFTQRFGYVMRLSGPSMLPTIKESGDNCIVSRTNDYAVGDIVVFKDVNNPNRLLCKRIRAGPGDKVTFTNDGKAESKEIEVDHYWLEGDNAVDSRDSRNFGQVPSSLFMGRVVGKYSFGRYYKPHFEWFSRSNSDHRRSSDNDVS